jgi:hypothetical protein
VDPKTGKATLLSYSGLITPVTLGAKPVIGAPWSLQQAAFMRKGTYTPMDVNWMPGGRQPIAVHHASGRIYVLMHMGEYWSEYEPAGEIWILDGNSPSSWRIEQRVERKAVNTPTARMPTREPVTAAATPMCWTARLSKRNRRWKIPAAESFTRYSPDGCDGGSVSGRCFCRGPGLCRAGVPAGGGAKGQSLANSPRCDCELPPAAA